MWRLRSWWLVMRLSRSCRVRSTQERELEARWQSKDFTIMLLLAMLLERWFYWVSRDKFTNIEAISGLRIPLSRGSWLVAAAQSALAWDWSFSTISKRCLRPMPLLDLLLAFKDVDAAEQRHGLLIDWTGLAHCAQFAWHLKSGFCDSLLHRGADSVFCPLN